MEEHKLTNEDLQELTALREEKRTRVQTQRAAETLKTAGIPQEFASLLIGTDDADTDARTAASCRTYQANLSRDIKNRLPSEPPVLTTPKPTRPRCGIVRVR